MDIELKNAPIRERHRVKSDAVVSSVQTGRFEFKGWDVEVVDVKLDGTVVEVLAKAFRGGRQMGFGLRGEIEIERFRFVNPPLMVEDGTTRNEVIDGEKIRVPNFKEDPAEAFRRCLVATIALVATNGDNITKGKIGSTVTTVFASYGAYVSNTMTDQTWATVHDALAGTSVDTTDQRWCARIDEGNSAGQFTMISRGGFTFDTSAIPDTDIVSAATVSIFGDATTNNNASVFPVSVGVFDFTPATGAAYVTGDFDQFGSDPFASAIPFASWSTTGYNTFTLNATGRNDINKQGNTVLGTREAIYDAPNRTPTGVGGNAVNRFGYRNYTATGTSIDPTLVVTHAAPVRSGNFLMFMPN